MALAGISPDFGLPTSSQSSAQMTPVTQPAPYNWNVPGPNSNMGNIGVNQQVLGANTQAPAPTSNNPAPTNNSNLDPHINPTTGQWDDNYYAAHNQPDLSSQIDALYNPAYEHLNQSEQILRDNYAGVAPQIQQDYDTNAALAGTQQSESNAQLNQYQSQNNSAQENALAASRRLYSELQNAGQQRFGGSSSAGLASSQIIENERQRQMGQTMRTYADAAQNINLAHQKVNDQYNNSIMQLTQNKQNALYQAKNDFNTNLSNIQNIRFQTDTAKAQSSLQALQDYRNKIFQINAQQLQFADTLAAQRNQAASYINNYSTSLQQYQQSAQGAYQNAINSAGYMNPTSNIFANGGNQQPQSNQYTGAFQGRQPNYQLYPNDGFSY